MDGDRTPNGLGSTGMTLGSKRTRHGLWGALVAVASIAALWGSTALAGTASRAEHGASTIVSIAPWSNGVLGTVRSRSRSCSKDRRVKVFKQRGVTPHPKTDKLLGARRARKHVRGVGFQWSLAKGTSGTVYAKAGKAHGCRVGYSKSYRIVPRGDIPECPSTEPVCHFPELHLDISIGCPSYILRLEGDCDGRPVSGRYPWNASHGFFHWYRAFHPDEIRGISYAGTRPVGDDRTETVGTLSGWVPGHSSDALTIDIACAMGTNPGVVWYTPSVSTVTPGDQGGPLHLDFQGGTFGADVYIRGYLYYGGNDSRCSS
jgi:hypothetical protein